MEVGEAADMNCEAAMAGEVPQYWLIGLVRQEEVPAIPPQAENDFVSNGAKKSTIDPRFFLLLAESLRFLVWIPSFFIVSGLGTCNFKFEK